MEDTASIPNLEGLFRNPWLPAWVITSWRVRGLVYNLLEQVIHLGNRAVGHLEWEGCASFEVSVVAVGWLGEVLSHYHPMVGDIKLRLLNLHSLEEASIRAQNVITAGLSKMFIGMHGLEAVGEEVPSQGALLALQKKVKESVGC
jgi:hypothetical protein